MHFFIPGHWHIPHDRGDQKLDLNMYVLQINGYRYLFEMTNVPPPRIHVTTVLATLLNTFATVSPRTLPPLAGSSKHWLRDETGERVVVFPVMWVTSLLTHPVRSIFISVAVVIYSNQNVAQGRRALVDL